MAKKKVPMVARQCVLPDGDYTLEGSAWFTVGKFSIRIHTTDKGVAVVMYPCGNEMADSLASCYAFNSEVEEAV